MQKLLFESEECANCPFDASDRLANCPFCEKIRVNMRRETEEEFFISDKEIDKIIAKAFNDVNEDGT